MMSHTTLAPFAASKSATLFALFALSFHGFSSAATIDIEPAVYGEDSIDVSIVVDGHEQCRITRNAGEDTTAKRTPCRFSTSTTTNSIVVTGQYSSLDGADGPRTTFKVKQTIDLVDFGPVGGKLTASGKPFGQRVVDFISAARQFASQHELQSFDLEGGKRASAADIDQAQKRLGYPLPEELVSLLTTVGEIREGDNSMTPVASIADSYTTMLHVWETDESDLIDSYSPAMLELLKASTLLYTEVGDGLGGLLYRPPPTKACGDRGLYVWTSQEGGTESLSNNGACPDFDRVFRWLLDRFVIEPLANELQENTNSVLIDTSSSIQHLQLSGETYETFRVTLRRSWDAPIMKGE